MHDEMYMARAMKLAQRGRFTTHPNPNVGCVIVKDGEIVGEGFHYRAGEPHAEVHALRMAGEKARGATAYVTLEPCSHHGRTPPCCEALIAAGVNPGSIEALGRGDEGATSMNTGTFDETAAQNDRRVVVTLSLA